MQAQQVELGTVVAVRKVQIEGSQSGVGTVGGAAVGAIAGSAIGGGRGSAIASVLGGIGGLVLGSKMEEGVTQTEGQELTVKLETGNTIAVVQAAGEQPLQVGERVRVLSSRDETRVVR
jgi:outer membrane lipoprotein SlyB